MLFTNRFDAGEQLAEKLSDYKTEKPVVLALPRGGVAVGFIVAKKLRAPLDVLVVRKIGAPGNSEFAIGAIAEGGIIVIDPRAMNLLDLSQNDIQDTISEETAELERRVAAYRGNRREPQVKNKTVILIDDGLATGATAQAAISSLQLQEPKKLILAIPVCAADAAQTLAAQVNALICPHQQKFFSSVAEWYETFEQLTDEDVIRLLEQAHKEIQP